MLKKIKIKLKNWWRRHIADVCPPHLEDIEFSEKFRKTKK